MSLLVVGSIAFDSIRTLHAQRDYVMGGSAIYSAFAASFFSPVRMMGIVGGDWPSDYMKLLHERRIDTRGIQIFPDQKTFHWKGRYSGHEWSPNRNDLDIFTLTSIHRADFFVRG
ncbi:MAG: hypothetical protein U0905_16615 [Pirellulales bacterium]